MDVWIRFIGLILLYQAQADGPYLAIIPKWTAEPICERTIVRHAPFIRVTNTRDNIVDATKWPEKKECPENLHCTAFLIPDDTELAIGTETGFMSAQENPTSIPCLVPDFGREGLITRPRLRDDALTTRSAATLPVPNGEFFSHQFDNAAIFVALKVPASASASGNIRITATARNDRNADPHVLVLKPGTVLDIINVPEGQEVMDYEASPPDEDNEHDPRDHFFFLHKLLTITNPERDCIMFPQNARGVCDGARLRRMHAVRRDAQGRVIPPSVAELSAGATHGIGCGPGTLTAGSGDRGGRRR